MSGFLTRLWRGILPLLGMVIFITLFILGLFVFSYLLIIGAIIGLILFSIAFIRAKFSRRQAPPPSRPSQTQGRTIEHDDSETRD